MCEQNCKPGSVFDSHLSSRRVAAAIQPPREQSGRLWKPRLVSFRSHSGVAPDRVYSGGRFRAVGCALTAPFHLYLKSIQPFRKSISVALFLRSLSAGVTRYPCPMEPGLSSQTGLSPRLRDCLFYSHGAILADVSCAVKAEIRLLFCYFCAILANAERNLGKD